MEKSRNYGIDLLRIVLIFMVCVLHTLGHGGVLSTSVEGTLKYNVYWLIEIFSYCAVDGFAIISGYTANNKPKKYEKIVDKWFQILFYSFVVTLIFTVIGINDNFGIKEIIQCLLPITFNKFWYMTAYFALFFSMPILNKFVFETNENTLKKELIITFILFSIMGVLGDPFKSSAGYSTIWLMVLYYIGAISKRIHLFESKKSVTLTLMWLTCIFVTWITYIFLGTSRLINYISPTILLSGLIMVILFSRMKLKGNIISKVSSLTLGVYLFQLNQVVWNNIINGAFCLIVTKNIILGVLLVLLCASIIFILGLTVEFIRNKLFKLLNVSLLSQKVVECSKCLIEKSFVFLK